MVQDPVKRRGYDEDWLKVTYPKTYAYLKRFEKPLRERSGYRRYFKESDPFYSMFNIGEHTFARYKVVWREVAHRLDAAVTGPADPGGAGMKATIPDHTVILVACDELDEAHYLCAALNSAPSRFVVQNYIVLHPDPHVLDRVAVPRFDPANAVHVRLAELSRQAHEARACADESALRLTEAQVDDAARELWGLTMEELAEIQQSMAELE